MIARLVIAVLAVLTGSGPAHADYFVIDVTVDLLPSGHLRSAADVQYYNSYFWEIHETVRVVHSIAGDDEMTAHMTWGETPWYGVVESTNPGVVPNCYKGKVYAESDVTYGEEESADQICFSGPVQPPRDDFQHWDGGTNWFDPLVLDLNGDGVRTTGSDRPVSFDLDADGTAESLTWLDPESKDAFLWTDLNHNNRIDDGSELFGVGTMLPSGRRARHGFEALAMYDLPAHGGDANGLIDDRDDIWPRLRLWRDDDHDGQCDGGERAPLAQYGVEEIRLSWKAVAVIDASGTLHMLGGTYLQRGYANIASEHVVEALGFAPVAPQQAP